MGHNKGRINGPSRDIDEDSTDRGTAHHSGSVSVSHYRVTDYYTLRRAPRTKERLTERAHRAHLPERTLAIPTSRQAVLTEPSR